MVFSYSKYNLGTDFTMFIYLAVIAFFTSIWAIVYTCYLFNFKLERRKGDESTTVYGRSGAASDYDSETESEESKSDSIESSGSESDSSGSSSSEFTLTSYPGWLRSFWLCSRPSL